MVEITWLNGKKFKEVQVVRLRYGNQAELKWVYSSAAIMVEIPEWGRKGSEIVL
jgi:hypothetical protein